MLGDRRFTLAIRGIVSWQRSDAPKWPYVPQPRLENQGVCQGWKRDDVSCFGLGQGVEQPAAVNDVEVNQNGILGEFAIRGPVRPDVHQCLARNEGLPLSVQHFVRNNA